jgi:hypothetical protein
VDPSLRVRAAPADAVRVDEEVVDALLAEERVDAVVVAALGQPDAARPPSEGARVRLHAGADLRAPRPRPAHQRQEAVGGVARQDLEQPVVLQLSERRQQVATPAIEERAHAAEPAEIMTRDPAQARGLVVAAHLALGELGQARQVPVVAATQQLVVEHRRERRRDRHGDAEPDALFAQAEERLQQRHVGLGDRLEEPVLLEEVVVLGVAHERQVRVQHQAEVAPAGGPVVANAHGRHLSRSGSNAVPGGDGGDTRVWLLGGTNDGSGGISPPQ